MYNRLYRDGRYKCFLAKDFQEAFDLGFFTGSMHKDVFIDRITRYNPSLRWIAKETHKGLFDSDKGFICGVANISTVPKYSIMEYDFSLNKKLIYTDMYGNYTGEEITNQKESDYQVLARGWDAVFGILEKKGYKVDRRGL